jgi:hypothetical protein
MKKVVSLVIAHFSPGEPAMKLITREKVEAEIEVGCHVGEADCLIIPIGEVHGADSFFRSSISTFNNNRVMDHGAYDGGYAVSMVSYDLSIDDMIQKIKDKLKINIDRAISRSEAELDEWRRIKNQFEVAKNGS